MRTKIPAPAILTGAPTVALTLKLAPANELLKEFSKQWIFTVAVLFTVAAGINSRGAITMMMDKLIGHPNPNSLATWTVINTK